MSILRIVLADDHALVRAGFRALLENLPGIQVVGEASDGNAALKAIEANQPDIAIVDIAMPGLSGLEVAARVTKTFPKTRVMILSMHATEEYARRAIRAGAVGYLLKDADAAEFKAALQAVAAGEIYLSPAVSKHIVADYARHISTETDSLDRLTPRQREVLQLIAEGLTRKEIAERMSISVKTFDAYRAELMEQLDIHDVAGLVRYAIQKGLVHLDK